MYYIIFSFNIIFLFNVQSNHSWIITINTFHSFQLPPAGSPPSARGWTRLLEEMKLPQVSFPTNSASRISPTVLHGISAEPQSTMRTGPSALVTVSRARTWTTLTNYRLGLIVIHCIEDIYQFWSLLIYKFFNRLWLFIYNAEIYSLFLYSNNSIGNCYI